MQRRCGILKLSKQKAVRRMKETTFNKKQLIKYLIWTFGIAYLMQAAIGVLAWNGLALAAQPMMAVMMFVPLLGVLLSFIMLGAAMIICALCFRDVAIPFVLAEAAGLAATAVAFGISKNLRK